MKTLLGVLLLSPSLLFAQQSAALSGPVSLEIRSADSSRVSNVEELEVSVVDSANPKRRMIARGHSITFTRTDQGELTLLAPSVRTPF